MKKLILATLISAFSFMNANVNDKIGEENNIEISKALDLIVDTPTKIKYRSYASIEEKAMLNETDDEINAGKDEQSAKEKDEAIMEKSIAFLASVKNQMNEAKDYITTFYKELTENRVSLKHMLPTYSSRGIIVIDDGSIINKPRCYFGVNQNGVEIEGKPKLFLDVKSKNNFSIEETKDSWKFERVNKGENNNKVLEEEIVHIYCAFLKDV